MFLLLLWLQHRNNENPTVINARLSEIATSRFSIFIIYLVNTPQVIATIAILALHWDDSLVCDAPHTTRWKWWAIFSALRMVSYCAVVSYMHLCKAWLDENPVYLAKATSFKNSVDAFALIWFIVGNMWLFGDDDRSCAHPSQSPIYNLCMSMLIINYVQICLPCILVILLIPVFCLCMPCLIRLLAQMQNPRASMVRSLH